MNRNNQAGPTSSQGSDKPKNKFAELSYLDEDMQAVEPNRSSSVDLRNGGNRGPSELERQQSKEDAIRSVQNLTGAKNNAGSRNMSPASGPRG